jgi:hypothetical protein
MQNFSIPHRYHWYLLLLIYLSPGIASSNAKTDIVIMKNRSYVVGEIKNLRFGILSFDTDHMGTLSIEWDEVKQIYSKQLYRIGLVDGSVYFGSIDTTVLDQQILIRDKDRNRTYQMERIVKINPIKESFWDIIEGYVKFGFTYTKSSDVGQLILGSNLKYRTNLYLTEFNLNSIITSQENESNSTNQLLAMSLQRLLGHKWLIDGTLSFDQNTELGVDLRTSVILGGGYSIIQTNHHFLYSMLGLGVNKEAYIDSTDATTNLEGVLTVKYELFKYDHPKQSLSTKFQFLPGLTNWGRIRFNYNLTLDWEIFRHFYWDVTFYDSYDNQPGSSASSTNDYGITTSIKYDIN